MSVTGASRRLVYPAAVALQAEHLRMRPGEIRCWNEKRDRVYYLALVPTLDRVLTSLGVISGHLALTLLAEEGVPLHVIKAFADHADVKVTERYLHARRGPMDEAARTLEQRYESSRPNHCPARGRARPGRALAGHGTSAARSRRRPWGSRTRSEI